MFAIGLELCFILNRATISAFPVDDDGACPDLQCDNMCLFGNVEDRSGCRTCVCRGAGNIHYV